MQVKGSPHISKNIKNILLIQLGDIGDAVLSLPCLRALRENFPDARLIVALREKTKGLLDDCPWADGEISINQEKRSLIEEVRYQKNFFAHLRRFHFDLSINLRLGDRSAIISFLSGARQRISFYTHDGRFWQNRVSTHLNLLDYEVGQYVADYYSSLLAAYHVKTQYPLPQLEVPPEKLKQAKALFAEEQVPPNRPIIALQPFSSWRYKELAIPKYIELIRQINSEYGLPVCLVGSADEKQRLSAIARDCGPGVYNLAGKTTLGLVPAVLKACAFFIGVDSAGIHIAAAVGTPTVSIFGPSAPASWAPRGPKHLVVHRTLPCFPCRQKGCDGKEQSR
ncbi:MAG: glycosyltransferase family 9 protein, partial [Syntrophales bacterium LBB04]|nr:glycosyltransferase family 9 protein [Syntrophales bacterium LBB04]